jgi:hypothetical protein
MEQAANKHEAETKHGDFYTDFVSGAEWARKETIKEVCEFVKNTLIKRPNVYTDLAKEIESEFLE